MERMGGSMEQSPEELLEECLDNPERIDELSREDCEKLMDLAQSKIIEIFEPYLKARYQSLIQRAQRMVAVTSRGAQRSRICINDSYVIDTPRGQSATKVNTCEINNLSQAALTGVDFSRILRSESYGCLSTITDREHRFWINLKFLVLKQRDGTELRLLFIADWYVDRTLRGTGIGKQLQQLAWQIGEANGCSSVFCLLVPENPNDLERLKSTNQRMGYQIRNVDGSTVAQRLLE